MWDSDGDSYRNSKNPSLCGNSVLYFNDSEHCNFCMCNRAVGKIA